MLAVLSYQMPSLQPQPLAYVLPASYTAFWEKIFPEQNRDFELAENAPLYFLPVK